MKKLLVSLMMLLTLCVIAKAQDNKAYETAIAKMLEVSKTMDAMKQMAPQMTAMIKQQAPEAPKEMWNDFEKTLINMYGQIIKEMIPVYQKYLTLQDIQGIIKFYESPVGKKLADSNTQIAMETMPIAQKIAMETMQNFMTSAQEKGYIKK